MRLQRIAPLHRGKTTLLDTLMTMGAQDVATERLMDNNALVGLALFTTFFAVIKTHSVFVVPHTHTHSYTHTHTHTQLMTAGMSM